MSTTLLSGKVRTATSLPTQKTIAGTLAGAVSAVIVFILNTYVLPPDQPLPPEIAVAVSTIISCVVMYLVPPSSKDGVVPA